MELKSYLKLIMLGAIWGFSFIFLKVASPAIGAIFTTFSRLFIAGIVFLIYYKVSSTQGELKKNWKIIAIIGLINTSIPFTLYAAAALYIPASISAIINSMSPMFGMLFSILLLKQKGTLKGFVGILLGIFGVVILSNGGGLSLTLDNVYAILACVVAASCYGLGTVIIKKYAGDVKPIVMAGYSQLFASFYLIPLLPFQDAALTLNTSVIFSVLMLAFLCSAFAYIIYYHLVSVVGPTKALTVTFLTPMFSILWGALFLHESITLYTIAGMLLVLVGTRLVLAEK